MAADVPLGSRHLNIWLRRTRLNKVRKLVREVYLRDDIVPDAFEGADSILVLDTNIALHQIDFIAEDECVNHVVVPYTVLQEVRNRHMGTYARLRSLCRADEHNIQQKALFQEGRPVGEENEDDDQAASSASGKNVRNAHRFYVFPNEYFSETFVTRHYGESVNDRNSRAIRRVAHWYRRHVFGPEIFLLTDDKVSQKKALADGIVALSAKEFVDKVRTRFPSAGEKLSLHADLADDEDNDGRANANENVQAKPSQGLYPVHLKASEIEQRLKKRALVQGVLRMHRNTCSFGTVECNKEEIQISGRLALNRAVDGDVVAVEKVDDVLDDGVDHARKRARHEDKKDSKESSSENTGSLDPSLAEKGKTLQGRIVGIIKRSWREYCGTLKPLHANRQGEVGPETYSKMDRIFIPADARIPNIMIQTRQTCNLENKRITVVLDGWDRHSKSPRGHWTRILGDANKRDVESAVILHEHGVITREFSEAVLRCLPPANWTPSAKDLEGRKDLRNMCVCSVDPPGCKDIDDAVSCEPLANGNFRVGVHIADVTHFVHPNTAVDKEASERCTTVYLVERRTDMLPGLLTADICSLRGGVERLTFSVLWEITPDAHVVSAEFTKAIIKSRAALSYAEAQARIDDPQDSSELTVALRQLNSLAKNIREKRVERGALELASQEVKFELDSETQDPTDVAEYKTRDTNKMIEEFMLLANHSVAKKILDTFPMFGVLRRHPAPKTEALKALKSLLDKHGVELEFENSKQLGSSLSRATKENDPYFNHLVRMMVTRCMNQAVYFCTGEVQPALYAHYGLAMDLYTHFTSPIRRYADVLVHRLLAASLGIAPLPDSLQSKQIISDQCDRINMRHRNAQWASRASAELHTFMFFNKVGTSSTEAIVTRIRRSGMQVIVPRYGFEGMVMMTEEDWIIDEDNQCLEQRDGQSRIQVFDHISVKVETDNSEFRHRTTVAFLRVLKAAEHEVADDAERSSIQKEMYPDRLVQEPN